MRTYIIMGSGNLEHDIRKLAELFALTGIGPRSTLRFQCELLATETGWQSPALPALGRRSLPAG